MTDINSISAALTSISAATEIAKLISSSNASLAKSEQKMKLAELIGSLADTKIQLAEVQQEIIERDQTIKQLEEKLNTRENLIWEAPYYWIMKNSKKDGPYCQKCQDSDDKLIRLQAHENGYWDCKSCHTGYHDKSHIPATIPIESDYDSLGWMGN